jgi:hypothetical protein
VKQPLWQRLRRDRADRAARSDRVEADDGPADRAVPTDTTPTDTTPTGDPPAEDERPHVVDAHEIRSRLHAGSSRRVGEGNGSGPTVSDRQATYAAWAERLKSHKKTKLAGLDVEADPAPEEEPAPATPSAHWASENLFEESRRADEGSEPELMSNRELLGVLGLTESASSDDVHAAYRTLAKEHHPDRWTSADEQVRKDHREQMLRGSAAYRTLRERGR